MLLRTPPLPAGGAPPLPGGALPPAGVAPPPAGGVGGRAGGAPGPDTLLALNTNCLMILQLIIRVH